MSNVSGAKIDNPSRMRTYSLEANRTEKKVNGWLGRYPGDRKSWKSPDKKVQKFGEKT